MLRVESIVCRRNGGKGKHHIDCLVLTRVVPPFSNGLPRDYPRLFGNLRDNTTIWMTVRRLLWTLNG